MRHQTLFYLGVCVLLSQLTVSSTARACGGFFCNSSQPVNQAAERIIFADNGDDTVTAVIQIQYQGPSQSFSWLLPIPTAPRELKVASDQAFTRLQNLTNPSYTLQTVTEGNCATVRAASQAGGVNGQVELDNAKSGAVQEIAAGRVGPYDWTVIKVDDSASDKSSAARDWLTMNKYDVPAGAAALLNPYLEDHMVLLAIRLSKGQDSGAIRPVVLTYQAKAAMIPVKLTAVAANKDMGVMTWLLGTGRGVPSNYNSLELNEARIDWFNPSNNYNDVVIEAANSAGGQGFVTEFSGSNKAFEKQIWLATDEENWNAFLPQTTSDKARFEAAYNNWSGYDGFWDAVQKSVTLSQSLSFDDFKQAPLGYIGNGVTLSQGEFVKNLDELVMEPLRVVQKLIDAHPQLTRLYTTLSAEEMTVDPLFTFNGDLPDVSNLHVARRVISCANGKSQFDSPWRVELPQGGVVHGEAGVSTWPSRLKDMPPNRSISKLSASGSGQVLEDNSSKISAALAQEPTDPPAVQATPNNDGCNTATLGKQSAPYVWLSLGLSALLLRRRASHAEG